MLHSRHDSLPENYMRVKSSMLGATGIYELFAAPSPHNSDYAAGLPQLWLYSTEDGMLV
jgi:hypothetical protein